MNKSLLAACCFIFLAPTVAYAQEPNCEELKAVCEKDILGKRDCRRYREVCLDHRRGDPYCQELRYACIHKHELGEEGAGNCSRYREECH